MTQDQLSNEPQLIREDADGVATLTLNRPAKYNVLSTSLMADIQSALDDIAADPSIRVVVITGRGKAFSAGHDLAEMKPMDAAGIRAFFDQCSKMMVSLTRIPQPVIAKVQGTAAAAGCQLVAQCDLAVAADDVRFATSGIKLGLFCSTPMVAVTRSMQRKKALEMLFTGDFIDAPTAEAHGLINRSVHADQLDQEVDSLAAAICDRSPTAIAFGKDLFYRQIEEGLESAYDRAAQVITDNMMASDAQIGVQAFLGKTEMPDWPDRES